MKGCMNCGNISCGNNKKRDCAGCGRWISPEDKIAELERENAELKSENEANKNGAKKYAEFYFETNEQLTKAKEIIKYLCGMVRELNKPNVQLTDVDYSLAEAEQFLEEIKEE